MALEILSEDGIEIELPSGASYFVLTDMEQAFLEKKIRGYMDQNKFSNDVDLADLDKIVTQELLIHRWGLWMGKGRDYWNAPVEPKKFADLSQDSINQVRQLKKALGLDKITRDRTHGDDSVPARWDNVLQRAGQFVYMRSQQCQQILASMNRIKAIVILYEHCNEDERLSQDATLEDVIAVVREEIAAFDKIDDDFKQNVQRYWIRKQ